MQDYAIGVASRAFRFYNLTCSRAKYIKLNFEERHGKYCFKN